MYTHTHTHTKPQHGSTALLLAAELQHEDIVTLLIEVDADPNLKDKVMEVGNQNFGTLNLHNSQLALFPWLFPPPVFDHLQYANRKGEGLVDT